MDTVFPEWMFNVCVEDVKEEKNMMLVDVMADRIVKAERELREIKDELHKYKLEYCYPSFKTFSISQSLHAIVCDECGTGVTVVEKGGRTLVACPRCGVSAEATSTWFHHILHTNKRVSLPIR